MRFISIAVFGVAILGATSPLRAQTPEARSATHEAAAAELFEVIQLEDQATATLAAVLANGAGPEEYRGTIAAALSEFFDTYMTWDVVRPMYLRIYMEVYTEQELRELAAFYRTPLGTKTIQEAARMTRLTVEASTHLIEEHREHLQRIVMRRMEGTVP